MVLLRDNTVEMWRELWRVIRFFSLLYRIVVVRLLETVKQFSSTQKRLRDSLIVFDCSVIYLMIAERIPPNPFIAYQFGLKRFGPFNIWGGGVLIVYIVSGITGVTEVLRIGSLRVLLPVWVYDFVAISDRSLQRISADISASGAASSSV